MAWSKRMVNNQTSQYELLIKNFYLSPLGIFQYVRVILQYSLPLDHSVSMKQLLMMRTLWTLVEQPWSMLCGDGQHATSSWRGWWGGTEVGGGEWRDEGSLTIHSCIRWLMPHQIVSLILKAYSKWACMTSQIYVCV